MIFKFSRLPIFYEYKTNKKKISVSNELPSWLEVDKAISAEEELGDEESFDAVVFSLCPLPFSTRSLSLLIKKLLEHPPWLDLYPSSDTSELLSHRNASLPPLFELTLAAFSQIGFEETEADTLNASPLFNVGIALLKDFCNGLPLEEFSDEVLTMFPL